MIRGATLVLAIALVLPAIPGAAETTQSAAFGKPFGLKAGHPVALGPLTVQLTVDRRPLERGPNGIEMFPITYFGLEWRDGSDKSVLSQLRPQPRGDRPSQYELFDRYTFTMQRGAGEDDVTLTVYKRRCLLRYTSSNQLKHKNGEIIFTEREDLCCYYSDGRNTCDPQVTRAQHQTTPRYCVLYSKEAQSAGERCCCRYERGEPLNQACATTCARLMTPR